MYLNLNFGSPHGSRLREATVTITLDDQDARLDRYNKAPSPRTLHHSGAPVQVTEWYGPRALGGEKKSAIITSKIKAVPEANILSYGVGGVGYERSKQFTKESRWSFHGEKIRGERTSTYTTLRWHLTERELDSTSSRSPQIHTAFAFEHSGQAFIIKVQIEGRLQHIHEQLLTKLKFGLDGAREGKVVTLVDFEDYTRFSRGLDDIAKGLPRAMEMANLENIPVELPDSIPVSFQQDQPPQSLQPNGHASHPQALAPNEAHPQLEASCPSEQNNLLADLGRVATLTDVPAIAAQRHEASQMAEDIARAEDWRRMLYPTSSPVSPDHEHRSEDASPASSTSTFFSYENEETGQIGMDTDALKTTTTPTTAIVTGGEKSQSDLDGAPSIPNMRVLSMQAAWGLIVQLLASILDLIRRIFKGFSILCGVLI